MGSSGVLGYCGMRWFKLIVSRRYDGKRPWGFTLMRRRPGGGMPVVEYFVLSNGKIPSFDDDVIYPFITRSGKRHDGVHLSTGTIIKLYDYQIGSRFSSGFRGAREALNENLVETILPFRLLDFRQKPDPTRGGDRAEGIDPRPFYGMEFLLIRSHKENLQEEEEDGVAGTGKKIAVATIDDPYLGRIEVSAIALKRSIPGWLEKSNNRVFHAVNGQVQFKQTRGYLSQTCRLPALKDRVIIIINASNLTFEAHNDIWKGDREHIRNTIVGERYQEMATEAIRGSQALKDLQRDVAREELSQATKSQGDGREFGEGEKKIFEGKRSPTFLRFGRGDQLKVVEIPINGGCALVATTNVENDYLQRSANTGVILLEPRVRERFGTRIHLHNGKLAIHLAPVEGAVKVGDKFRFKIALRDDLMAHPVEAKLSLHISHIDKTDKLIRASDKKEIDKNGGRNGRRGQAATHGLPKYLLLTKDGRKIGDQPTEKWPSDFDEHEGGTITDLGNNEVIYKINYDNAYHLNYRSQQRGDIARDVVTEKYILGMRILMLGFERAYRAIRKTSNGKGRRIEQFAHLFRAIAARGAGSTVLSLAENFAKIVDKGLTETSESVE